ncbi:MAG: hypothetical protein M1840_002671 [Geoglossum simile]|nr:MAG: hypothetical protein M1840_002671 [Geoglossum simile]
MNADARRYRTRATGPDTVKQDSNRPAVKLLARYLQSKMKAPTYVSMDPKVTTLLGYRWVCKPGVQIPKTNPAEWSADQAGAVMLALRRGKLKAVVKPALCLDTKRTPFAENLLREKEEGFQNCVNLIHYVKETSPPLRFHTDDGSINVDGSGHRGLSLDTSSDSATVIHARPPIERPQDEDTDGTRIMGNDPFSEELLGAYVSHDPVPIPHGNSTSRLTSHDPALPHDISASQLALPEFWATRVKPVEDMARGQKRKGATVKCLTRSGTELTPKSFKSLFTDQEELDCKIIDACLSMLDCPEVRPKIVIFESAFWRTYQGRRGHLGRWHDMVAPSQDVEMFLFPVYQDDQWTLFEVSRAREMIRHYAPDGLDSTDIMEGVRTCLKIEFEFKIEGWTVEKRLLPQGNSGILTLATAVQRVLRKDVVYSQEDIPRLRRWITAILLGMDVSNLHQAFDSFTHSSVSLLP